MFNVKANSDFKDSKTRIDLIVLSDSLIPAPTPYFLSPLISRFSFRSFLPRHPSSLSPFSPDSLLNTLILPHPPSSILTPPSFLLIHSSLLTTLEFNKFLEEGQSKVVMLRGKDF